MSNQQSFDVVVDGIEYHVETSTRGSNDTFMVYTNNGRTTITDSFGECNPLRSLWSDWRYQTVHGAAREAMEIKCIKDAVRDEVQAHLNFCLENLDELSE